ncbi:MAG: carbon storage regulator [Oscillospiraceae bacterium]
MLVITRRASESIIIGKDIEIIVSEVSGDKVKICIDAPKDIPVMRKELLETKKLNVEASRMVDDKSLEKFKSMAKVMKSIENSDELNK